MHCNSYMEGKYKNKGAGGWLCSCWTSGCCNSWLLVPPAPKLMTDFEPQTSSLPAWSSFLQLLGTGDDSLYSFNLHGLPKIASRVCIVKFFVFRKIRGWLVCLWRTNKEDSAGQSVSKLGFLSPLLWIFFRLLVNMLS